MGLFSCFSRVFCVRQERKILGKFGGFPWLKQNNQGKEGQGTLKGNSRSVSVFWGLSGISFRKVLLVSHYSAIGDTISCDAPYSAIGLRGKLFLRYPPLILSLDCDRPFSRKGVGV